MGVAQGCASSNDKSRVPVFPPAIGCSEVADFLRPLTFNRLLPLAENFASDVAGHE